MPILQVIKKKEKIGKRSLKEEMLCVLNDINTYTESISMYGNRLKKVKENLSLTLCR